MWGGLALIGLTSLLLTVEFLLGIYVNLYDSRLPSSLQNAFQGGLPTTAIGAHVVVGVLLGLFALLTLVWAVFRHRPHVAVWAVVGLLGVLVGAVAGDEFLVTQQASWSFVMALGFLLSFVAYTRAAGVLARHRWMMPPMTPVAPTPP